MPCSGNGTVYIGESGHLPATLPDRTQMNLLGTQTPKDGTMFLCLLPQRHPGGLTLNRQSMGVDVIWDSKFIFCLRNSLSPTPSESCGHHTAQTLSQTLPRKGPGTSPDIQPRNGPQGLSPTQICSGRGSRDLPQHREGTKGGEL